MKTRFHKMFSPVRSGDGRPERMATTCVKKVKINRIVLLSRGAVCNIAYAAKSKQRYNEAMPFGRLIQVRSYHCLLAVKFITTITRSVAEWFQLLFGLLLYIFGKTFSKAPSYFTPAFVNSSPHEKNAIEFLELEIFFSHCTTSEIGENHIHTKLKRKI